MDVEQFRFVGVSRGSYSFRKQAESSRNLYRVDIIKG